MEMKKIVIDEFSMRFVALLRCINVGGKNTVAMPQLKQCFENLGFKNVLTYINSGNVIFEAEQTNKAKLVYKCETAIEKQFGFRVVCSVIAADELHKALKHAPTWWDNGQAKHNAIFVIAPKKADEIIDEIGEAKPGYEHVAAYHPIIFWSAPI